MKQEFITLRGKLTVEGDQLIIRNVKLKDQSDFYRLFAFSAWFSLIIYSNSKAKYLATILLGLMACFILFWLIDRLFLTVLKNKIYLNRIKSYKVETDPYELETRVMLYFKSGRKKEIVFRTHENQHEAFL